MNMGPSWRRGLALTSLALAAAAGLVAADKLLSRPDRIAFTSRTSEMRSVRDAILRCEFHEGRLPADLDALVPRYLRATQVRTAGGAALYRYNPRMRLIAMVDGARIRGLFPRHQPPASFALPLPDAVVLAAGKTPVAATPAAPIIATGAVPVTLASLTYADPPANALVFEAELLSEMNWAWEIHPEPAAGGGAVILCKEATTTGASQSHYQTFNFLDPEEKLEQSMLKYHIRVPRAGRYTLFGRLRATCSHCSNNINVGLDCGGLTPGLEKDYEGDFLGSGVPFRWVWSSAGSYRLTEGDHYIHVFPHEDGLDIDQFMLCPDASYGTYQETRPYKPTCLPNQGTAFERQPGPPVHLSFDLKSRVFTADMPLEARLAVRRLRPGTNTATLVVALRQAGRDGSDLILNEQVINLTDRPELELFQVATNGIDCATLPRREYLLTAELRREGQILATGRVALMHPFVWEVSRMWPFYENRQAGPLDPGNTSTNGDWHPFADTSWLPVGALDFGLQTTSNSLHALEWQTIYVRTEIDVPQTASYLFKLQSDDQMRLWLDGRELCHIDNNRPLTRNILRHTALIEAGRHALLLRINQTGHTEKLRGSYWQASVRIRTHDDHLSGIIGVAR